MKRGQKLLMALVGLGLLLGATLAVQLIPQEEAPLTTGEENILFTVDKDSAQSIRFQAGEEELSLVKKEEFWYFSDLEDFPVDQDIPQNMIAILAPLQSLRTVKEDPEDPSVYGFDEKSVRVSVKDKNGTHEFILGSECQSREGYYLRTSDSSPVYLAQLSVGVAYLHEDRYSLIQIDPYPNVDAEDMTRITLHTPKGSLILVQKEGESYREQEGSLLPADKEVSQQLWSTLSAIKFSSCKEYKLSAETEQEIFSQGTGFTVEYDHVSKDGDGKETVTRQSFSLSLSPTPEEEFYSCKLSDSTQLCLTAKEAVETLWELADRLQAE